MARKRAQRSAAPSGRGAYLLHRQCRDGGAGAAGRRAATSFPVTLELGGKSPQLVFADADLEAALPFLVRAAIQNAGQTCSAGSRVLIERPIFDPRRPD